ncbi:hypothetical protein D4764_10G0011990 [Takifugu flavidus]|uniref:Uncharacterized protein n=1 Tax=Takifugu flavidus TaxID=433684 RepID=A0A5C6PMK6_9TELE|nr:hypothetical protein D4764_10G0011990 [Takifugu flavidus]
MNNINSTTEILQVSSRFLPLIRIRFTGAAASGGMPKQPSPRPLPSVLLGDPKPGERCNPSPSPGPATRPPPGGTCPEHLEREASGRQTGQMPEPPQLTPFDVEKQRFHSELLPDVRASHPISKAEPGHPAEETHFSCLYPRSRSDGNHPTLLAIDRLSARITADAAPIRLSISRSILPSLVNKIPRYLNSSTWGRTSSPTQRRHSTFFPARTMDYDLEVLIRIPAASHSDANRPSICWRSLLNGARRTTSSAKSSDEIFCPPNSTLSPCTPAQASSNELA